MQTTAGFNGDRLDEVTMIIIYESVVTIAMDLHIR